jgi:transcription-repair coupling factor (superfamily II helicase)
MRDLDIRGAGNILGAEQSGFISEIGFEMYQKILDEALHELKETDFSEVFPEEKKKSYVRDCVIETDLEVLIPDHYVTNITERLNLYKELDSIESEEGLMQFTERVIDRFGPLPKQTDTLLHTIRLRWLARSIGFEKLVLRNRRMTAYFISNPDSPYYQSGQFTAVLDQIKNNPSLCRMKQDGERLFLVFSDIASVPDAIRAIGSLLP